MTWKMRPQKKRHLSKARSSAQTNESEQLAQEYTRFEIKIREDLIQHLVKIRSWCVPESPNLDILKTALQCSGMGDRLTSRQNMYLITYTRLMTYHSVLAEKNTNFLPNLCPRNAAIPIDC